MQITRETDYAIRCVCYLARKKDQVVMVDEIARAREIPKSFLAKILQRLKKARIVKSYRGMAGGFQLARKAGEISLLDIIEAIEGPVVMNRCSVAGKVCNFSDTCSVHPVWVGLRKTVESRLRKYDIASLARREVLSDMRSPVQGVDKMASNRK